jgi:GxxExxY protein
VTENEIRTVIVDSAVEVHRTLGGPGLVESVYEEALAWELKTRGHFVARQATSPILYKGMRLASPLRIDLLVYRKVIVECKATPKYIDIYAAQALTYLRRRRLRLALVINFGARLVKNGIHRVVNGIVH